MHRYCRPLSALVSLALLLSLGVFAGPPITITDNGYYVTEMSGDGTPYLVKAGPVVDLRTDRPDPDTPDTDPDDDPKDPPPKPPEGFAADVQRWAEEADKPLEAQKYEVVFATARDAAGEGLITSDHVFDVLRLSADQVLSGHWEKFRRLVSDELAIRMQAGELDTPEELHNTLEAIRFGLGYATRHSSERLPEKDGIAVIAMVNNIIDGETDAE